MNNPYPWLQDFVDQVPDVLQPLIIAVAAAIPYVEGPGAAAFGIIAGINPIIASLAGATGNIIAVILVAVLGSRVRGGLVARRANRAGAPATENVLEFAGQVGQSRAASPAVTAAATDERADEADPKSTRQSKGRARLRRWMVRFGVPGASILAPVALPTMLTAAFFVASGVSRGWVILWQIVAIILWTGAIAAASTGILAVLGW